MDVGAHIGSVIAAVRAHDPRTRIAAVEAVPEKAAHLAARFPEIELHQCAVGDEDGRVKFFVDRERPGYSSLTHQDAAAPGVVEIEVRIRRLDDLLADTANIGMIKVDVEGAELQVIRGAAATLERTRPTICFESASPGDGVAELFDQLVAFGYELCVPNRVAHDAPGLSRDAFVEAHYYPRRTTDYFAIHVERRAEFRDRARRILGIRA